MIKERNEYIDWLKGLLILLVVVGHCWLVDDSIFTFIYKFHMPFYFGISGYLFSNKKNFREFAKTKFKNLIIPYTIFFSVSAIISYFFFTNDFTFLKIIKYFLLNGKYCSIVSNFAIWYLPTFFITSIIFYFFSKLSKSKFIFILILILLIIVPINNKLYFVFEEGFIPFSMQAILPGILFMGIGKLIKENVQIIKKQNILYSLILFLLGIILTYNNYDQIINITSIKYIFGALCIIFFIIKLTYQSNNKVISSFGKNSLYILGYHRIILIFLEYYNFELVLKKINLNNTMGGIILSVTIVLLIDFISNYYRKIKTIITNRRKKELYVI